MNWKTLYREYWPFNDTWHNDNFTADERGYYGYRHTITSDAEFLIEFGDIGSLRQAEWMKPRLAWLGQLLAHCLSKRSGLGAVPDPSEFGKGRPKPIPKFILKSTILTGHRAVEEVAAMKRILRKTGEKLDGVEFVQDGLNALADAGAPAFRIPLGPSAAFRGFFGAKTKAAVEAFQTARKLEVDGAVGSETILSLDASLLDLEDNRKKDFPPKDGNPQPGGSALNPKPTAAPVGTPAEFFTQPSKGTFNGNSSKTSGLEGVSQKFDDGTIVREATETLTAVRDGEGLGPRRVTWRQVRQGNAMTVEQKGYSWDGRKLPNAILIEDSDGIAKKAPKNFTAQPVETRKSTQFGKFDYIDEGTGAEPFGVTQTNSDVFGASVKKSRLIDVFGTGFATNPKRLGALVEIYLPEKRRYACVPLVDVGPGETKPAHIDLTFALDKFLGTEGEKDVAFRIIIPT